MGYRVDYDLLDSMFEQLGKQTTAWQQELKAVKTAVERIRDTDNMSGVGADAIRIYYMQTHTELVNSLLALVDLHNSNFELYKMHYQRYLDDGLDTVIVEEELGTIIQSLDDMKTAAIEIDSEARTILWDIADIVDKKGNPIKPPLRGIDEVADAINEARGICSGLNENIHSLEIQHSREDFVKTELSIRLLTSTINELLGKSRNFKENYDSSSWTNANRSYQLSQLSEGLINDLNGKAEAAKAAVEYHESRKELEKRIETAKWEKILVTGVVVIASAITIVALPVSGPLVVGLVNGVSSAIIGANNKAMDLYVVDGDLSGEDWAQVAVEGSKGYLTGLATGVVGGVAGEAISGLTHGIPALQSGNAVVNTATHIAVGSVTDVTTGIATRATGEVVEQLVDGKEGVNWSEVGTKAFDGGEIIKDAIEGGAGGYKDRHKVNYSESMNSDYEKGLVNELNESGDLEYTVDPELDSVQFEPKPFKEYLSDYTIKYKDECDDSFIDQLLSPDDYDHEKYETKERIHEIIDTTQEIIGDDTFKSNDEILQDINKTSPQISGEG